MIMQKGRAMRFHSGKMGDFFREADVSGDGLLDRSEFRRILRNDKVKTWLAAQDLDASNADNIFALLDPGTGKLSAHDLVKGVGRLKGTARSMDLLNMQR